MGRAIEFNRRMTNYENRVARFRSSCPSKTLAAMIERICGAQGRCRILDLGGTESYVARCRCAHLAASNCHITLLNVVAPDVTDRERFTAIAEMPVASAKMDEASSRALEFDDRACGRLGQNVRIRHEVRRSRPHTWCRRRPSVPLEPHFGVPFWHWLPEPVRVALLMRRRFVTSRRQQPYPAPFCQCSICHLIDARMMAALFADGKLIRERVLGLTKSFVAMRTADRQQSAQGSRRKPPHLQAAPASPARRKSAPPDR